MHVGFVSQYVYPHDEEIRITKCAATLVRSGHRVTVFCRAAATAAGPDPRRGIVVRRFGELGLPEWLRRITTSTLPINPLWILWLWRQFRQHGVDLAIVRNLRLAPATILASALVRIPVVMDLGENHPALAEALGRQRLVHYIIRNQRVIGALERWCVCRAGEVWVVAEANRARLGREVLRGRRTPYVRLIRNLPEIAASGVATPPSAAAGWRRDSVRLVYLGILDTIRGVDIVLQSLALLAERGARLDLVVVGDGSERHRLEKLVHSLSLTDRVKFHGWVHGPQRFTAVAAADIGLIPHRVCYLTQTTLPNKLFDYMLCGLPVISTPLEPVSQVLKEVGCGLVADLSPEVFGEAMMTLARNLPHRVAMGERGRRAVLEHYNWETESRQVIEAVERLGGIAGIGAVPHALPL